MFARVRTSWAVLQITGRENKCFAASQIIGSGSRRPVYFSRMEWITHSATGFFIGQLATAPEQRPRRAGWWWTIAAISPDWLEFATHWFGDVHRGITHSLYMWPVLALGWAVAARRWGGFQLVSLTRLWVAFAAIVGSHLFLDVLMPYRWYLAWPFSRINWAWDIMPLFDVYVFGGWLVLLAIRRWRQLPPAATARAGLAIFVAVFAIRGMGKLRAQAIADGVLPSGSSGAIVQTVPDYFQPWIWYARRIGISSAWVAVDVLTGQPIPGKSNSMPPHSPVMSN